MNLKVFLTSSIPKFSTEQYTHGRMLNKSLLLGSISFPLNPEVIKEFNMKNQCLEIGIFLLPFLAPDQILLHCQGLAQMLYHLGGLSGCWSLPLRPFSLSSHHCLNLSH